MKSSSFLVFVFFIVLNCFSQDARVLKKILHCNINENKIIDTDTLVLLINNRNGDKYGELEIPYSRMEPISQIQGWIEDTKGLKIKSLSTSDIKDNSYRDCASLYQDVFVKTLRLKHNSYPYKVIYTYITTRKQYISIANWTPVYNFDIPTDCGVVSLTAPHGYKFQQSTNKILQYHSDTLQNSISYNWTANYTKQILKEKFSPSRLSLAPFVKITPKKFYYGIEGDLSSWHSFGCWFYNLSEHLNTPSKEDIYKVKRLIENITDKKEQVRLIYHFLQDHTRYINVSFGIGGLKPFPASYVSENKYGDCKALTNYLKALLESVDIQSFYTIIEGNNTPTTILRDFPSQQFNHVILTVPIGNDTLYLENTSTTHPFGFVGPFIQNRDAFLIEKNQSRLIHIPAMKLKDVINYRTINIKFDNMGNANTNLTIKFHGESFEAFNGLKNEFNQYEQDRIVRDYIPFSNYNVINWTLDRPNRDSDYIELKSQVNLSNCLKKIGDEFYFSTILIGTLGFESPQNRTLDVSIPYPIAYDDSINYSFPSGYKLKTIPEGVDIKSKYGKCEYRYEKTLNGMIIIRKFCLYSCEIPFSEYSKFYEFIEDVSDCDKIKFLITAK